MKTFILIFSLLLFSCDSSIQDDIINETARGKVALKIGDVPNDINEIFLSVMENDTIVDSLDNILIWDTSFGRDVTVVQYLNLQEGNNYKFYLTNDHFFLDRPNGSFYDSYWRDLYMGTTEIDFQDQTEIPITLKRKSGVINALFTDSTSSNIIIQDVAVHFDYNNADYDFFLDSTYTESGSYADFPNNTYHSETNKLYTGFIKTAVVYSIQYLNNENEAKTANYTIFDNTNYLHIQNYSTNYTIKLTIEDEDVDNGELGSRLIVDFISEYENNITIERIYAIRY